LEAIPAADGHHDPGVHLTINEESLSEATAEIVRTDVLIVFIAGFLDRTLGGTLHNVSDTSFGEID
jgi:hypothetical protein